MNALILLLLQKGGNFPFSLEVCLFFFFLFYSWYVLSVTPRIRMKTKHKEKLHIIGICFPKSLYARHIPAVVDLRGALLRSCTRKWAVNLGSLWNDEWILVHGLKPFLMLNFLIAKENRHSLGFKINFKYFLTATPAVLRGPLLPYSCCSYSLFSQANVTIEATWACQRWWKLVLHKLLFQKYKLLNNNCFLCPHGPCLFFLPYGIPWCTIPKSHLETSPNYSASFYSYVVRKLQRPWNTKENSLTSWCGLFLQR